MRPSIERDVAGRLFKHLARLVQAHMLYPEGSERRAHSADMLLQALRQRGAPLRVTLLGEDAVVEDQTVEDPTPIEALLVKALRKADWESLRISHEVERDTLLEMAGRLVSATPPPVRGRGYEAGHLTLEHARAEGLPITNAAVGYLALLGGSREALGNLAAGKSEGIEQAREIVAGFAGHLASGRDVFKPLRSLKHYDEYTFTHALNVALLTMSLGRALDLPAETLEAVSLGALCHDVGKERISKEILNKPAELTPQEQNIMNRHPLDGARILLRMPGPVPSLVPVIAYQHHMTEGPEGYPEPLPGQQIHPASRLVAVADTYDALRTVRPYRPARSVGEAFTYMLADTRRGRLRRPFLEPLAGLLGVAVPGRRVRLTDGREAVVVRENEMQPLRPSVGTDEGEVIDLASAGAVSIAGIL